MWLNFLKIFNVFKNYFVHFNVKWGRQNDFFWTKIIFVKCDLKESFIWNLEEEKNELKTGNSFIKGVYEIEKYSNLFFSKHTHSSFLKFRKFINRLNKFWTRIVLKQESLFEYYSMSDIWTMFNKIVSFLNINIHSL